jgi:sugar phosphate isomerase/epimerase
MRKGSLMFGVSPAFVFSLYTIGFTVQDYRAALPRLHRLGFRAFQPEIYVAEAIPEWLREAGDLQHSAADLGLLPSQFVAHFMLEWFASPERLGPNQGLDDLKRVVEVVGAFPACRVITVPAAQFQIEWGSAAGTGMAGWADIRRRVMEKIRRYLEVVSGAGLKLAFEIAPFSVIGGIRRFLDVCDQIGSPDLGLNFDTGHAWACREIVPLLPFELQGRIFGTHLGDNRSTDNVKMPLGHGTVPWAPLLRNLHAAGYRGSLDIEVVCPADQVELRYQESLQHLQSLEFTPQGESA